MATVHLDRDELSRAVKEAVSELVAERPELLRQALAELIEDAGLAEAIRQGREEGEGSREELDAILRGET